MTRIQERQEVSNSIRNHRSNCVDLLTEKLAFSLEAPAAAQIFLEICLEACEAREGAVLLTDPTSGAVAACPASKGSLASRADRTEIEKAVRTRKCRSLHAKNGRVVLLAVPLQHEKTGLGCLLLPNDCSKSSRRKLLALAVVYSRFLAQSTPAAAPSPLSLDETGRLVHDFRNIVAGLSGYAQILNQQSGKLTPKQVEEYSGVIQREAERLGRMADAHLRSLRGEKCSIRKEKRIPAEIIGEVHALMAADLSARGIHLLTRIESEKPLQADPDLLQRALVNLVFNARQALSGSGVIEIAAENAGHHVEFRISDSGPGIPPEIATKIFHSPASLNHRGKAKGNGLGLRIVKEVADLFHGSVRIEPSPFGGATIVLSLPA